MSGSEATRGEPEVEAVGHVLGGAAYLCSRGTGADERRTGGSTIGADRGQSVLLVQDSEVRVQVVQPAAGLGDVPDDLLRGEAALAHDVVQTAEAWREEAVTASSSSRQ